MAPDIGLPLMLVGATLLWSVRIAYGARRGAADDWLKHCLTVAGWMMLLIGAEVIAGLFTLSPLILVVPIFWTIVLASVHYFRQSEQQSLVWMLAFAAERGLPLSEAVRAFAQERTDEVGFRAWRLADALDAGMSLDTALVRSKIRPSLQVLVAARVGEAYGVLPEALRSVVSQRRECDRVLRSMVERFLFLLTVISVFIFILTFVMISIMPTFEKMFKEFELELPPTTKLTLAVSQLVASWWWLTTPLHILISAFLVISFLYYVGWLPWNFPFVSWLRLRYDRTVVLRTLAFAVQREQTLEHALATLDDAFPTQAMRRRLGKALLAIRQGTRWPVALAKVGLITNYEQAVLTASERVGNLSWALDVLADNAIRRLTMRLRVYSTVITSVAFCVFSLLVLLFAASVMMPLASLIWNLA